MFLKNLFISFYVTLMFRVYLFYVYLKLRKDYDMKYLITAVIGLLTTVGFAQDKDVYTKDGDKLCVERYDEREILREEGCFINDKADGKWTQYDVNGNIQMVGHYNQDIKEGKWFAYSIDQKTMYEVVYKDNSIETYNLWKIDKRDLTAGN